MKLALIAVAALIVGACSRERVTCNTDVRSRHIHPYSASRGPRTHHGRMALGNGYPHRRRMHTWSDLHRREWAVVRRRGHHTKAPGPVWDYGDVGIMLRGLTPGVAITLRASAAGYRALERAVFPDLAGTVESFA